MKKKFEETKVGSLIKNLAPGFIDMMGDVFPPVKLIKSFISGIPNLSDEQAKELDKAVMEYELKEYELYLQEMKMTLDDTADARNMQMAALAQDDKFSKRFIYYLASGSLLFGFTYILLITFANIPDKNQRFADTILGVVITTIIGIIYNFFFGGSKGSNDKNGLISKLIK